LELVQAMRQLPNVCAQLSLSDQAEIMTGPSPPMCDLPVATYGGMGGLLWRLLGAPAMILRLGRRLHALRPDLAVCAMAGPLDALMLLALRLRRTPVVLVVHDADPHPGDVLATMVRLQRMIVWRADVLVALSTHVANRLRQQGLVRRGVPLGVIAHPPLRFGPSPPPPFAHGGPARLLFFGRLLTYKGLDLLAEALRALGPRTDLVTRIVGSGPETPTLVELRRLPGVAVENRWVPEGEIGAIIAWSDAVVLPYREASQSGPAAAAIAARRNIVATRVGGLIEQLEHEPLALLCDPEPTALADALRTLLTRRTSTTEASPDATGSTRSWQDFAQTLLSLAAAKSVGSARACGRTAQG
jgi:glycosyltransferase involved in cell wall biosynthesis